MSKKKSIVLPILLVLFLGTLTYMSVKFIAEKKRAMILAESVIAEDQPFDAVFDMSVSPDADNFKFHRLNLYKNGIAILEDFRWDPIYYYFTYRHSGDEIYLKGDCCFFKHPGSGNMVMKPMTPADIVLKKKAGEGEILYTGKGTDGKKYALTKSGRGLYSDRGLYESYQVLLKEDPRRVWVVTDGSACTFVVRKGENGEDIYDDNLIVNGFQEGEMFIADPSESPEYLLVNADSSMPLCVYRSKVENLGSRQRLLSLLRKDASPLQLMKRQNMKLDDIRYEREIGGYLYQDWKAGKKSIYIFLMFAAWFVFLMLMARHSDGYGLSLKLGSVYLCTFFELWYFATAGDHFLWTFEWSPLLTIIAANLVMIIQGYMIYDTLAHLKIRYDVQGRVSPWLEYGPVAFSMLACFFLFTADVIEFSFLRMYSILMLGAMPGAIANLRQVRKKRWRSRGKGYSLFFYIFLCIPMGCIIVIISYVVYAFGEATKHSHVTRPGPNDAHVGRFGDGSDSVDIYRLPNGDYVDSDGHIYDYNSRENSVSSTDDPNKTYY